MNAIDPIVKLRSALADDPAAVFPVRVPGSEPGLSPMALGIANRLSDRLISRPLFLGAVRLFEAAMVAALGAGSLWYTRGDFGGFGLFNELSILGGAVLSLTYIQAFEGYSIPAMRTFFQQFGRVIAGWTLAIATLILGAIITGRSSAAGDPWMSGWFGAGVVFFAAFRFVLSRQVARWVTDGRLERRAVIVGGGHDAADLIRILDYQPDNDIRICGIFDDRGSDRSPDMVAGYPKLGNVTELVEFGRRVQLDMLIVTVPLTAESRLLEMMRKLWVLPVDIRLSAHTDRMRFRPRSCTYVGHVPLLNVVSKPLADWDFVAKRAFDIGFSACALLALSPIMLAAAVAVKMESRGPVLFRQKRYGFNNELVNVWKFRSMYTDMSDATASRLVTKDDPRVTRVGHFIRKTSIDELPQLFNVLAGTLSLVGPRPHALAAKAENQLYEKVVDGYFARHKVKPGVTGWAQINGWRGETDTAEKIQKRVEYDLYYIENWSIWFDLKILLSTPFRLFSTDNAY